MRQGHTRGVLTGVADELESPSVRFLITARCFLHTEWKSQRGNSMKSVRVAAARLLLIG